MHIVANGRSKAEAILGRSMLSRSNAGPWAGTAALRALIPYLLVHRPNGRLVPQNRLIPSLDQPWRHNAMIGADDQRDHV